MDHIDATLRMFVPDIELDEIKPKPLPPRHRAFKGQVTRAILTMLRKEGTMDARAITLRLMAERELNVNDSDLQKAFHKRIGAALRNLRERQLVASQEGARGLLVWGVSPQVHIHAGTGSLSKMALDSRGNFHHLSNVMSTAHHR